MASAEGRFTTRAILDPSAELAAVIYRDDAEPRRVDGETPYRRREDVGTIANQCVVVIDDPVIASDDPTAASAQVTRHHDQVVCLSSWAGAGGYARDDEPSRCAIRELPMQSFQPEPTTAGALGEIAPKLAELSEHVLFGDIWERPGLSKRDRSLMTIAALTVLYRTDQLRGHIARGLDNGLTEDEIIEAITQMAFYGGWPTGVNAARVAQQVFAERGLAQA